MVQQQVVELIKVAMPAGAVITSQAVHHELEVRLSWKLNDDPERPNKRSRPVTITMSEETADDVEDATAQQQAIALERIGAFLHARFNAFDGRHDDPRDVAPAAEHWVITHQVALG